MDLEASKYDKNQSIQKILRVRDILGLDRCVAVQLVYLTSHYSYSDTAKNCVQYIQLPVVWVIANKQYSNCFLFWLHV